MTVTFEKKSIQLMVQTIILLCFSAPAIAQFGGGMRGFGSSQFNMFGSEGNGKRVDFSSSNLPIIIIDTDGKTINANDKIKAGMKIIDNRNGKRNSITDTPNNYNGSVNIKLRGNSSLSFAQKKYTLETINQDGSNNNVELLGLPAENDWVLLAPYNDISMIRDVFAFDLWNEMGHWGPHTRMAEMVLNNDYKGVYILTEKIKRDKNRLDIANLKKEDNDGLELTGGYILRVDAYDNEDLTFVSSVPGISSNSTIGEMGGFGGGMSVFGGFGNMNQVVWTCYSPQKGKITEAQQQYIKDYIDTVERTIQSDYFTDSEKGYQKYIDVSSFVDYFIHTELSLNSDGFKRSAYFYKTKQNADGTGGKLYAGPVWDYNLAFGNCTFCNGDNVKAWVYEGGETSPTPAMWKRLTEDPRFMQKVHDRWRELRGDLLSIDRINSFIDLYAKLLDEASVRQYEKYDNLLVPKPDESHKNRRIQGMNGFGGGMMMMGVYGDDLWYSAYRVSSYQEEIDTLKKWFTARINFLDSKWL